MLKLSVTLDEDILGTRRSLIVSCSGGQWIEDSNGGREWSRACRERQGREGPARSGPYGDESCGPYACGGVVASGEARRGFRPTASAFWLVRGSHAIGGAVGAVLIAVSGVAVLATFLYALRFTSGTAPRSHSADGKRIERYVTVATVAEFVAAFVLPLLVSAAGHSDWVLPSIAITIGPLLLYLDRLVEIPRYRPVGWALTVGPVILVATLSGTALVATTGIAAGALLLATAFAGFHDLAGVRLEPQQAAAAIPAAGVGAAP